MENRLNQLKEWQKELAFLQEEIRKDRWNKNLKEKKKSMLKKALSSFNEEEEIPAWMTKFLPDTIYYSEFFGHYVKETNLTTNQIRNFFSEVRKLHMKIAQVYAIEENDQIFPEETTLMMLAPRLAYAAARAPKEAKEGADQLKKVLTIAINAVREAPNDSEKIKRFDNFTNFVEAIIAYHKTAGGE